MLIAEDIQIESEENGFHLLVDGERWLIADPDALYEAVKREIGPWRWERELAAREVRQGFVPRVFACNPDESGGVR